MPTPAYASWHRRVSSIFRDVTGERCRVIELSATAGIRTFELAGAGPGTVIDAVTRVRGGRASALPLYPLTPLDAPTVWVSWFERWDERRMGRAEVRDMSATFYWGTFGRPRIQLLRAEWAAGDAAPDTSAQPHWQVDTDFITEVRLPIPPGASPTADLVELPGDGDHVDPTIVSISGLHLGMAGWRNASTYPAWWRYELGVDEVARAEWLRRLLQHASDQFLLVATA